MFLLQILVGIAALCGFLFLPSAWGIPIFLVWALQMIFWVFLQEYYPYADKIRGNPAAEYNGYRRLFCRKAVPSLASLAVPERSVLVQRDDDTLFQVIRWKQRLYFRYLCSKNHEDLEIQQGLIQDCSDLDKGKKYGKKDFWLPLHQIRAVSYTKKITANTKYAAFGVLCLQTVEDAVQKSLRCYLLSDVSAEKLAEMFSPVSFTDETGTVPCYDTSWRVLKTLGRPKLWNLLLQICLWFSAAWIFSFFRLPTECEIFPVTFWLVCSGLTILLCWTHGSLFLWGKADDEDWLGLFADFPRVHYGLFSPMIPLFFHNLRQSNLTAAGTRAFFLIAGICSVILCLLFLFTCRKRTGGGIAYMIGFSLLFSCLFVGVGNRVYDFHAPMTERGSVAEKTYYFGNVRSSGWTELTLRREDGTKETLTDSAVYSAAETGDTVILETHTGLFGIGYYTAKLS